MAGNRNLADYYHWEETERGIRIYMHSRMADRLQTEVSRAAASGPDGGTEVGGILLGRLEEERGKTILFIDDFVSVQCSHRDSPRYNLSEEDTPHLEAALLRAALAGCDSPAAPSILGYYRSHLRDGLSLSPTDLLLIDSYFQSPASVFLVVKTVAHTQACTAGFFFWEDGRVEPEFSSLEVALGRTQAIEPSSPPAAVELPDLDASLDDGLPEDLTELFGKSPSPQPDDVPAPQPPPSARTPRILRGLLLRAATIVIASAALVISVVTYLSAPPREAAASRPAAPSTLGLRVERNPPDLLVSWNRYAREIVAARRATLSIRDGKATHSLNLNTAQLAAGSYLYTAASDDVQIRLEVYAPDDGSIAQSVRVSLAH